MKIKVGEGLIKATNLDKYYDENTHVLKDISFEINKGDIYGLIGMSGAGKSTLLRCMNGLIPYDSGSLTVDGREVKDIQGEDLRHFRKGIGMIFQHFALLERKTAFQNIAIPMQSWGYSKAEVNDRVNELLKLVGLEHKSDRKPRNLSGGEKQRVAIARALTMEPNILLCDEATSSLDPNTTLQILDLLAEINQKLDITIVVVTHQMEVIQRICNRTSVLENGNINITGDTAEIFNSKPEALLRLLGIHL